MLGVCWQGEGKVEGRTPLQAATYGGHTQIVRLLVNEGKADVSAGLAVRVWCVSSVV